MKNLYKKLLEVQKEIKAIEKDSINPHFKNRYFDINTLIAEIKPILNKQGVILMQPLVVLDNRPAIQTVLIEPESGDLIENTIYLPEVADPQKFGAIITYFRRYALTSLLLLEAEDDDGNTASSQKSPSTTTKPPTAPVKTPDAAGPKCAKCGAPMVHNPKTGKDFCQDKCWLKQAEVQIPEPRHLTNADIVPKEAPDDDVDISQIPF